MYLGRIRASRLRWRSRSNSRSAIGTPRGGEYGQPVSSQPAADGTIHGLQSDRQYTTKLVTRKLYCYVDESGQDTRGDLFVVTVVIVAADREAIRDLLAQIETATGKGRKKWAKATRKQRQAYLDQVIGKSEFRDKVLYARFQDTRDYLACVLRALCQAIAHVADDEAYRATVLIDGLGKEERHRVAAALRQRQVSVDKVRGLRDESDEFIRLADAMAGFVRDWLEGQSYLERLYREAVERGVLREIGQ